MTQINENYSRMNRKNNRKSDRILNYLIIAVILALIVSATFIFSKMNNNNLVNEEKQSFLIDKSKDSEKENIEDNRNEGNTNEGQVNSSETAGQSKQDDFADSNSNTTDVEDIEEVEVIEFPEDELVLQTIKDNQWQPIGTVQEGEHVSSYDGVSIDWQEKEQALIYATGLEEDNIIFWKIKNGGSPHKSIGIVSSRDETSKYRVFLEWIDGQGWKPVQMDVLSTLDFDY